MAVRDSGSETKVPCLEGLELCCDLQQLLSSSPTSSLSSFLVFCVLQVRVYVCFDVSLPSPSKSQVEATCCSVMVQPCMALPGLWL